MAAIEDLLTLYRLEGAALYGGEAVTQLEHALQCAGLAERSGASDALVAACFLHDAGHLVMANAGKPESDGVHQCAAMPLLGAVFPEAVLAPIRLHVDAKRYLCHVDTSYRSSLSSASRSLELQGGVFDEPAAARFLRDPYAEDALLLRRFDDLAKTPGAATPALEHYEQLLRCLAR
jgi:phosphonate degradation associated HDIG domain protein